MVAKNNEHNKNLDNVLDKFRKLKKFNNNHCLKIFEVALLAMFVCMGGFIAGYFFNDSKKKDSVTINDQNILRLIENYDYIADNYYENLDKSELIDSAIAGMMDSLDDPYSIYMENYEAKNMNIILSGKYEGLGIIISTDDTNPYVKVEGVYDESPADKEDIKSGDIIKSINDVDTYDMSPTEFSDAVLNSDTTYYKLVINRNDEEFIKILTKDNITIKSVNSKIIENSNYKIGYIYLSVFANNTAIQFAEQLKELESQHIDSLIIDVRNNTGGYLMSAESILKTFLTNKQIIYQLSTGEDTEIKKIYGTAYQNKNYDIVILGNEYSASASEILIAGLRDNLNSKYIGKQSYGKGTVQELVTMDNGEQYKITTKKWLTPKGVWINDTDGIAPDIVVELENAEDTQLNEAIKYLTET